MRFFKLCCTVPSFTSIFDGKNIKYPIPTVSYERQDVLKQLVDENKFNITDDCKLSITIVILVL